MGKRLGTARVDIFPRPTPKRSTMTEAHPMNRLASASSPYLLQHAGNPVHWFEWGPEAFEEARRRDVPLFLSVGYASCHWCHVMAHESFEDEQVADVLNSHFVSIKVDREERPDVDSVYMGAVQALTGRGGWPMSVFATPEGEPFFGGTYWPKDDRLGMPGFLKVLDAVITAWRDRRDDVIASGGTLVAHLREANDVSGDTLPADEALVDEAADRAVKMWDSRLGGYGQAPKFPQAMTIDFLLAHHLRTGDSGAHDSAAHSLDAMARGGIYDHVDGGFARYSVDERWLVPHFEKMLYDNALLLRTYAHAATVVTDTDLRSRFRRVAEETATYLLRDLRHPGGGFYSSTDADSEGEEGRFFVWSADELGEVVRSVGEDPEEWITFFGASEQGNWEGTNILHEPRPRPEGDAAWSARFDKVRSALHDRREQRVHPGLDDKVLTSWNGLVLGALADAGALLGEPSWVEEAGRTAAFLHETLVVDGALQHTWRDGSGATVPAFLEDVGAMAQGLLALHEASGEVRWFTWAQELAADADARFAEVVDGEPTGAWFATSHDAEALPTRPKDLWDNAQPSGASMMADAHLRLLALTGDPHHAEMADRTLRRFAGRAVQAPTGYGELLRAAERALGGPVEVAIVGAPEQAAELLAVYRETWRPGAVLAVGTDGTIPLLEGRPQRDGLPTAYVCRDFACEQPVTAPEDLREQLARAARPR
jgi:uncharacterized protein